MNPNLLIVGAGMYGAVAFEIAAEMGCFEKIDFVDDEKKRSVNGKEVIGTTKQLENLAEQYNYVIVAMGNPERKMALLRKIEEETSCRIAILVSPRAYVSPSAQIQKGSVIEPMAVIHTGCVISRGCIVSAGAVVNHFSTCCDGVHIDCNATVEGGALVPAGSKVHSGEVFQRQDVQVDDLFLDPLKIVDS